MTLERPITEQSPAVIPELSQSKPEPERMTPQARRNLLIGTAAIGGVVLICGGLVVGGLEREVPQAIHQIVKANVPDYEGKQTERQEELRQAGSYRAEDADTSDFEEISAFAERHKSGAMGVGTVILSALALAGAGSAASNIPQLVRRLKARKGKTPAPAPNPTAGGVDFLQRATDNHMTALANRKERWYHRFARRVESRALKFETRVRESWLRDWTRATFSRELRHQKGQELQEALNERLAGLELEQGLSKLNEDAGTLATEAQQVEERSLAFAEQLQETVEASLPAPIARESMPYTVGRRYPLRLVQAANIAYLPSARPEPTEMLLPEISLEQAPELVAA